MTRTDVVGGLAPAYEVIMCLRAAALLCSLGVTTSTSISIEKVHMHASKLTFLFALQLPQRK